MADKKTPMFRIVQAEPLATLQKMPQHGVEAVMSDLTAWAAQQPEFRLAPDASAEDRLRLRVLFRTTVAELMIESLRIAKVGAFALIGAPPRIQHWVAQALEDVGWEIRDVVLQQRGPAASVGLVHWIVACRAPNDTVPGNTLRLTSAQSAPEQFLRMLTDGGFPDNSVVLDPLCGTGGVGAAAIRCGWRFIGIEPDAAKVATATQRINDAGK